MKKALKSVALAAVFACTAPLGAQAQETAPDRETPAEMASMMCADKEVEGAPQFVCTAAQKKQLVELIERVDAMPVASRYDAMAKQYAFVEGLRQLFTPDEPPFLRPPKNEFEESVLQDCLDKARLTGVQCTTAQFDEMVKTRLENKTVAPKPAPPAI